MSALIQQIGTGIDKRTVTLKVLSLFQRKKREEFTILQSSFHPAEKFRKLQQTQRKYDTRYERIVGV